jgi:hypothetical protein
MAYATPADVAVRWGRELTPEETASIAVRLEDVERLIRRTIPDLDTQVDAGTINVEDVVQVESDSVLRMARNPEGFISETDGDYTYKLSDAAAANFAGGVGGAGVITEDEWWLLGVSPPGAGKGMFFITPRAVVGGGEYPVDWESETPESAGPQKWKRRRDGEDIRNYYRVLDWVRHRI